MKETFCSKLRELWAIRRRCQQIKLQQRQNRHPRFACLSCGQHISATRAQIGVTAPCPNCSAAVTVPKTSTLPPRSPAPLQTKFREKKRYETTVILIDDSVALLDNRKKLTKWTSDFTDARNWLIRELDALHGEQYFAGIFDHQQNRSVLKINGA